MKQHCGARRLAILALLLAVWCGPAAAFERLDDDAALARLQEMEKSGVLRDPHWAHAFWAQARNAPDSETRVQDLRWSVRFDEDFLAARWGLAVELLEQGDGEFANEIFLVGRHALRSFLTQQQAVLWGLTVGGGALLATFIAVALVLVVRRLPLLHHGVYERLLFLPGELRWGAALLTVVAPAALALAFPPTAAVLWLLAIGTAGAWAFLGPGERRVCITAAVLVLTAPVGLGIWTRFTELSHPDSYLRALWDAQESTLATGELAANAPPDSEELDAGHAGSLALLERRAGDYDSAIAHLLIAVRLAPDEWSFHNNLGNALLLNGDTDGAMAAYARAAQLAPDQPLVKVNEAQAWMRQLRFNRAEAALQEAARMGYHIPRVLNNGPQDIVVRDRVLDTGQFWVRFAQGDAGGDRLSWSRAAEMTLAPLFPLRPLWMSFVPFAALALALRARSLPKGHRCAGCGKVICRKCHYRVLRRSLCSACNTIRVDVRAPLKREVLLRSRRVRTLRWARFAGLLTSVVLPGTGQLLSGAPRRGGVLLGFAAALLLLAGAGTLWPAPGAEILRQTARWSTVVPFAFYALLALASVRAYWRSSSRNLNVGMAKPGSA
ncbi:MAG TPA: tetratricopeptide repeat protein [bacterium]|nr:tetratricopeptide repeat protein [bacterium]